MDLLVCSASCHGALTSSHDATAITNRCCMQAIPAFEEAVMGMQAGGIRRIEIPGAVPSLGYAQDRNVRFTNEYLRSDLQWCASLSVALCVLLVLQVRAVREQTLGALSKSTSNSVERHLPCLPCNISIMQRVMVVHQAAVEHERTPFLCRYRYRYGPQPGDLGGQRALDFVLDNPTLRDFNRNLVFDIKLLAVRPGR